MENINCFNVIIYDPNKNSFEKDYNIIPYLHNTYNKYFKEDLNKENLKKFIISQARYQFWARCEYEIILVDWPNGSKQEKIDVFDQIMMNIDIITEILYNVVIKTHKC